MKFLRLTNSVYSESLTSYIQRISYLNYIGFHDIWRYIMRISSHYPQSAISYSLDICPESFIELNKLASMLNIEVSALESLTYMTVFQKLGINKEDISHSRVLSNVIDKHRKYCPECLKENPIYKLIWQVKEIDFCHIHNAKLYSNCIQCGYKIPILPNNSEIGECPNCHWDLKKCAVVNCVDSTINARIIEDWTFLLSTSPLSLKLIDPYTSEQSLAIRLLFISYKFEKQLNQKEKTTLSSIMQIARNTKTVKTSIHINTILHFTRKFNVSLKDFFTLEVPNEYINSLFNKKDKVINQHACIAPWCSHYLIPGSLEKTSTSIKNLESGQELKYYMYCNDCGTEYGIDKSNNKIVERGYFIDLAWNQVKNALYKKHKFTTLAKELNTTEDKLKRSIIFLAANNLIDIDKYPIEIPSFHDPKILSLIKNRIVQGAPARQIQRELDLKYNNFLFYWLYADIRKSYINYVKHFLRYLDALELRCPCCGGKTIVHGSYERHVHIADTIEYIPIQRVKCCCCNKTHVVIPDFISPRKHYSACDIESALNDLEEGLKPEKIESEASIQTVRRWWAEYKDKLPQAAGALRSLLYRVFNKTVNELLMTGVKSFALLEHMLEAFPRIDSGGFVMGEANMWLSSHWTGVIL